MSQILDFIKNQDPRKTAHFFCHDCANELNVLLTNFRGYIHPQYSVDWDLPWHEFHSAKYIYPDLIKCIWDNQFRGSCPCCGCEETHKLRPLPGGMFDLLTLQRSFDSDNQYVCARCDGKFASHKCVIRIGRDYICGDCAAYA